MINNDSKYVAAAASADISKGDETFIKTTIDGVVRATGLPAVGKLLIDEGIADRKTLRKMERKGILQCLPMSAGSGVHNCYYTEDALPKSVKEWREKQDADIQRDGTGASEGNDEEDEYEGHGGWEEYYERG